jgi:septum formation protein
MMQLPVPVVLASSSVTRRQLLAGLVDGFTWRTPRIAEEFRSEEPPDAAAVRLAGAKAVYVATVAPASLVIGADTLVVCQGRVMGKPADQADAVRMLTALTSSEHRVTTGLAVVAPDGRRRSACVSATVSMKRMSPEAIRDYCDRPDVLLWAGAYALEPDDPNVEAVTGSATAVMGLPMEELRQILLELYPDAEESRGDS